MTSLQPLVAMDGRQSCLPRDPAGDTLVYAPRDRPTDLSLTVDLEVSLESGPSHSQLWSKRNPICPETHQEESPRTPPDESLNAIAELQSISHSNCET